MSVAEIKNGKVVRVWRDIASKKELQKKYGLKGKDFKRIDSDDVAEGTGFDGVKFTAPKVIFEKMPISPEMQVIAAIIKALPPSKRAKVQAIFDGVQL